MALVDLIYCLTSAMFYCLFFLQEIGFGAIVSESKYQVFSSELVFFVPSQPIQSKRFEKRAVFASSYLYLFLSGVTFLTGLIGVLV